MKRIMLCLAPILIVVSGGAILWTARHVRATSTPSPAAFRADWNPEAAASYLDYRETWWQGWQRAQKDHGTVCVSCHTVVPYALVRPVLDAQLGETGLNPAESRMLESIRTRVGIWPQTTPYYTDVAHSAPSRGTESVLNAFILAAYDRRSGQFAPVTRKAFDEAWALQEVMGANAGGWGWQDFNESPWESPESSYWGAALMAIAVNNTPESYREDPVVRQRTGKLQEYLQKTYSAQPAINQLYVIWAAAEMQGLVSDSARSQFIARIETLQRPDGGWSLASLDDRVALKPEVLDIFRRIPRLKESDGCGTGLALLGLERAGIGSQDPALQRGLTWLRQHQNQDGSWFAPSLNGLHPAESELSLFMSDAATGYAVLALEQARSPLEASVRTSAPADGLRATGMRPATVALKSPRVRSAADHRFH